MTHDTTAPAVPIASIQVDDIDASYRAARAADAEHDRFRDDPFDPAGAPMGAGFTWFQSAATPPRGAAVRTTGTSAVTIAVSRAGGCRRRCPTPASASGPAWRP